MHLKNMFETMISNVFEFFFKNFFCFKFLFQKHIEKFYHQSDDHHACELCYERPWHGGTNQRLVNDACVTTNWQSSNHITSKRAHRWVKFVTWPVDRTGVIRLKRSLGGRLVDNVFNSQNWVSFQAGTSFIGRTRINLCDVSTYTSYWLWDQRWWNHSFVRPICILQYANHDTNSILIYFCHNLSKGWLK